MLRKVSCAFITCKLRINGDDYLLLRGDPDWNDLTLVGGHLEDFDKGNFRRTAIRETEEELPGLRWPGDFKIEAITPKISYGPVWSKSAEAKTRYTIRYYHLKFIHEPSCIWSATRLGSPNMLVKVSDLLASSSKMKLSNFVALIDHTFPGGIGALPLSWEQDLTASRLPTDESQARKINLAPMLESLSRHAITHGSIVYTRPSEGAKRSSRATSR